MRESGVILDSLMAGWYGSGAARVKLAWRPKAIESPPQHLAPTALTPDALVSLP